MGQKLHQSTFGAAKMQKELLNKAAYVQALNERNFANFKQGVSVQETSLHAKQY